jgi:hypothetical protein
LSFIKSGGRANPASPAAAISSTECRTEKEAQMALRHRVEYLRKEHKELLQLADRLDAALTLASHKDFPDHENGLAELRALEHGFNGIVEHCHSENRIVESTFHHYLNEGDLLCIEEEHGKILRVLAEFREELRFATVNRTMAMIIPGTQVVNELRTHIAHETELLDQILHSATNVRQPTGGKKKAKRALRPQRAHARKASLRSRQECRNISYTLEPHPELL